MAGEKEVVVGDGLMVAEYAWVATKATTATTGESFILWTFRGYGGGSSIYLKTTTKNEERL